MRPPRFATPFETFANVIPFQQNSLDAGIAIVSRLIERFGASFDFGGRTFHAFPTPHAIAVARLDQLRSCGLSAHKAESLRTLARMVHTGDLDEDALAGMESGDAIARLDELPGIGPWSAALVLLRGLGRLDVFPPADAGVARSLGAITQIGSEASLERVVARADAYRGYLYFCAIGGSLLRRGLVHAAPPAARHVDAAF
jgi:DNA-3-methyladenine glycosylase II